MAIINFQNFSLISNFEISPIFLDIYKNRNFTIIKKLSTRTRDIIPILGHTKFQVDILKTLSYNKNI